VSSPGRILALDPGAVRIGLAISDPDRKFAFPLDTYQRQGEQRDAAYFQQLVASEQVTRLLVGLPVHLDGREGEQARLAREFAGWLGRRTGLPVTLWDERFTTAEAESLLWSAGLTHRQRKQRRDRLAAQILLQSYLEAGAPENPEIGPLDGGQTTTPTITS